VHVDHATPVTVMLPEGRVTVYTHETTVGAALAEAGLALPDRYRVEPDESTPISEALEVRVVGVSEESDLEEEHIASQTVYIPDDSLPFGETRAVQGNDGVLYRSYATVYEDGVLISRELAEEWYDPEPVDTIVYYSTAEAPPPPPPTPTVGPLDSIPYDIPAGLEPVRTLNVYATWYNPASAGRPRSDPSYGITATGVPVTRGIVAVDPSVIPLGTEMYIPGYGYAIAADTGGAIRGNMIDLGYPDGVVPDWRSSWVEIYILG
jgi:3D (Asp-Asp-Asp) domain-containing protein